MVLSGGNRDFVFLGKSLWNINIQTLTGSDYDEGCKCITRGQQFFLRLKTA